MKQLLDKGNIRSFVVLAVFLVSGAVNADELAVKKVKGNLSVMVLGSGGPVAAASGRASAGYLIFVDGKPRVLMDVGGGTYQRLAASGVNIKDLDIVLLSHLHIDHAGDLSSVIKTAYFHNRGRVTFPPGRTAPFRIFGPNENGIGFPPILSGASSPQYPSTSAYIHGHYDLNDGVERYLNIFSRAISGGIFAYEVTNITPDLTKPMQIILSEGGLVIKAIAVRHGPVPALAYRIEYMGKSIVYSGDTNSSTGNMIALAKNADLLIYDTAITDTLPNGPNDAVFFALHTTPSRMGEVATAAKARKLVLSHITPITEPRLHDVRYIIRAKGFKGKIKTAKDLKVFNLDHD